MRIDTWKQSLIGKKVKIVSNTSGSGQLIGQKLYILGRNGANNAKPMVNLSLKKGGVQTGGWAYLNECEIIELTEEGLLEEIKEFEDEIKAIAASISYKEDLINFLKEQGLKEVDDELFKTYRIMKRLNIGSLADAKEVVNILNG